MQTYNVDGLFQHLTGVQAQRDKDVPLTAWLIHDNAVIGLALEQCWIWPYTLCSGRSCKISDSWTSRYLSQSVNHHHILSASQNPHSLSSPVQGNRLYATCVVLDI